MERRNWIAAAAMAAVALAGGVAVARDAGQLSFTALDADADGVISRDEMQARGLARIAAADSDGDGFLTRSELEAAPNRRIAGHVGRMIERMDADKDGRLSKEELMARAGGGTGFERLDADGDGAISRDEFEKMRAKMRHHGGGHGHDDVLDAGQE